LFRGRDYEVFFTQEIPLNDGPFKFYNLPGLIMKVNSSDSLFSFNAIGVQKINDETINIGINKQLEVSKNLRQYQEFLKSKSNDAYVGLINNGNAILYKSDPNKGFDNIEKIEE
jgi:GLPGLI family protein